ncbi:2-dehydropantoate 2-reductase [Exophiala aquamarina CBS 119918]|uniref:2-dehydropantoate 2-reductase n=1 Tax=Exophiala aquamarina CBS 119918 TaxID=1182545 RepID=A0A072PL18_9EURO|nr:2-dehydropantoate 2-reductase [Exophiala aquamarina CBS 119918]KEF60581.1 2-dehydropantoate 2-reductase [Exophiala aquamarina CBS 119918]
MISPNVLIFGVGSIGAVYLYQLQQAGCSVTAVCRSNYEAVKNNGFMLKSLKFGNQKYKPDIVVQSVAECPREKVYDFVLVCTKSFPSSDPSLADMIRPAVVGRPQTAIVLAQNGIDIEKQIADEFPDNPILSGVVYLPATQTAQGTIEYSEMLNLLEIGTYPSNAPPSHKSAAAKMAELMIKGGGGAEVHEDIQISRWTKLLMNAAWNPICALTLCTDGDFLTTSTPFAYELVWEIMLEIIALAGKIGIPGVTTQEAEKRLGIAKMRAESGTGRQVSMLQDVKQGRSFEVEAIVGNTVRLGRDFNMHMPRLETIYALLKARHFALEKDGR